jgi:hypothetical protein
MCLRALVLRPSHKNVPNDEMTRGICFSQMFKYSDEDYSAFLNVPDWTRKDTDSLMALVQRFGMNFVMVHDRYY